VETNASAYQLKMGSQIPDFKLKGVDDRDYSPASFKAKKILVVVIMCNHCPYVKATLPRIIQIQKDFAAQSVQLIGINANDSVNYPDDSFDKMKEVADEQHILFPYLRDETQDVAKAFKAQCTPEVFVFDQERKLRYHGRVDDNWQNPQAVKRRDFREALNELLVGRKVSQPELPAIGCSVKWKY